MRIEIVEVLEPANGRVAFRCAVGEAVGHWTAAEGEVVIQAMVDGVGADGDPVIQLRIGSDIVLVEMAAGLAKPIPGEFISFRAAAIRRCPYTV